MLKNVKSNGQTDFPLIDSTPERGRVKIKGGTQGKLERAPMQCGWVGLQFGNHLIDHLAPQT